ncbi:hypothetical protein ACFU93_44235 [Streptomyces sp. NPDC057611]|uniref:hypothetical protein n=1 Tax=Streptomyces sp. NPDC057611 TaxID=3346182 RepID=UPI00369468E0
MDMWEGAATLEWWANRSTCLGSFGTRVAIQVTDDGWTCNAILDPRTSDDAQEAFGFLMDLDSVFTLCFDAESALLARVVNRKGNELTLTVEPDPHPSGKAFHQTIRPAGTRQPMGR